MARGRSARPAEPARPRRGRRPGGGPSASCPRAPPARRTVKRWRSTPGAAADGGGSKPLGLQHRALLDVELQVGAEPLPATARLQHAIQLDAVLGEHLATERPSGVAQRPRSSRGRACPTKAELPNRLRPKRAPSSSAQSTSARVRGGRCARRGPGPQHAEPRHHPQRAVEPAAVGHGVEVRAERQRGLAPRPPSVAQRLPAASGSGCQRRSPRAARRASARLAPAHHSSTAAARPVGLAGAPLELAQVGDHPARHRSPGPSLTRRRARGEAPAPGSGRRRRPG